jgi:hypothetical protein
MILNYPQAWSWDCETGRMPMPGEAERLRGEQAYSQWVREREAQARLLTPQLFDCLRGEHEVAALVNTPIVWFGAEAGEGNRRGIAFCRHCRCLFVPREGK